MVEVERKNNAGFYACLTVGVGSKGVADRPAGNGGVFSVSCSNVAFSVLGGVSCNRKAPGRTKKSPFYTGREHVRRELAACERVHATIRGLQE